MLRIFCFSILLMIVSHSTLAQSIEERGNIEGIILDAETNHLIPYAVIEVVDKVRFRAAREDGSFTIEKLPPGNYTIRVTHINYEDKELPVTVLPGRSTNNVIYLFSVVHEIPKVVVKSQHLSSKLNDLYQLSHTLQGRELQKDLGVSLASTLKNEPGVAMRSMGPAPARPVIRGLSGDRVTISEDGIKTSDLSATSPDHAVTIDPFTIESVEIIRGPKMLVFSPTTIGGIVNVVRNETSLKFEDHILGMAGVSGESVNKSYNAATYINIPIGSAVVRGEVSKRKSSNLNTPTREIKNSAADNLSYSTGVSYFLPFGIVAGSIRNFEIDYGIPGGFVGAHPNGVNIEMEKKQYNFKLRFDVDKDKGQHVDFNLSRVYYRHTELESSGLVGAEFRIVDYMGNLDFHHRKWGLFRNGIFGFSFNTKDFDVGGFVFTPQTNLLNISSYLFEAFYLDNFNFEFALRANYGLITPELEELSSRIGHIREKEYLTYSASLTALYEFNQNLFCGININRSSRVPTIEELFSEGPHLAAYSYEVGNPELDDESGIGFELFSYFKSDRFYAMFSYFQNELYSYIIPRNTGQLNYTQLLPIYSSQGVEARLQGFESELRWQVSNSIELTLVADYTKGTLTTTNAPLPQIPPLKGNLEIKYFDQNYSFGLTSEFANKQDDVDEFEEPTEGYLIFGAFAQYSILSTNLVHNIILTLNNITNSEYRNHLSRIKSILPEAGFNAKFTYKLYFHI